MSNIPAELRYAKSHEWIRLEDDGTAYVGISEHAQEAMGDLVYVELPDVGAKVASSDETGVVESVKAASDIYAPVSGEILEVNETLADSPELVNQDCYGDGWLYRIKIVDKAELDDLMSAEEYAAQLEEDA
ncbi:MAG: glycine cleavage system protein H [Gammaproteobacteria bacterium HGW-Gammaproteobacteria-14]|nr:MAG: glycine cleavage system protein H [Gammaproteobacteria bacterium HGW-Gammaproteobacteria-14]